MIKFRVNGIPAPQGSKRHVGGGRMVEMSKAVGPWREAVRASAVAEICRIQRQHGINSLAGTMREPQSVTIVFVLARPRGHYRSGRNSHELGLRAPAYPAIRPDLDKLVRATLDGLQMGGVMADDSQVVALNAAKVYARNGEAPGAIIEVGAM